MYFDQVFNLSPYSLEKQDKERILTERVKELTIHHYDCCQEYKRILDCLDCDPEDINNCLDIPFLPVSLFKELELMSVSKGDIYRTMTSSGTNGQKVSRIYVDRNTANNQQKALVKIVSDFTGFSRMPLLIIDSPSVIKERAMFSARGAGILGFSIFGSDRAYALNDDMSVNMEAVTAFLKKHQDRSIMLFGFTFMVWQHFYKKLQKQGAKIDLSNGVLIHGGGWKKLSDEAVSPSAFKQSLKEACGLQQVHDYYGMVEQTGCIYMECEQGHLHTSIFSDVITRRPRDFTPCQIGEPGILQVISMLPESYPGHSLLTEDEGVILGEDDCPCGRKGKYFKVLGRLENAEIRGCSDTYAEKL